MKYLRVLMIIFLIQLLPFVLNANEKEVINKVKINDDNNSLFSFNKSTDKDNSTSLSDNKINDELYKKYLKKERGFLAMGIIGIILMPFPEMAIIGSSFIGYLITGYFIYDPFYLGDLGVIAVGSILPILFIIFGFSNYSYYKRLVILLKAPQPVISYDIKKETITLGLNIKL